MFKLLQCRVLLSALQLPLQLAYPVACLDSILQAKHTLGRVGELKWAFLCIPFTLETGSPSLLFITTPTSLLLLGAALHFCSFPPAKPLALHCAWLRAGCLLFFFFPYIQCRPSCLFSPGMALPLSIFSPACSLHDTCCCFLLGVQFKSFFFFCTPAVVKPANEGLAFYFATSCPWAFTDPRAQASSLLYYQLPTIRNFTSLK